jgi:uncharacterized transporter YbjL
MTSFICSIYWGNAVRYVIPVSLSGHSFVLSIGAMLSVIPVSLSGHSFVLSIGAMLSVIPVRMSLRPL